MLKYHKALVEHILLPVYATIMQSTIAVNRIIVVGDIERFLSIVPFIMTLTIVITHISTHRDNIFGKNHITFLEKVGRK